MPNPTTLAEAEQPIEDKGDPTNYEYEFKRLCTEMAQMADRAALEIKGLRTQLTASNAKADAYDTLRIVTRLLPQQSQGYGEDFAWRLEQRAEELRKQHG